MSSVELQSPAPEAVEAAGALVRLPSAPAARRAWWRDADPRVLRALRGALVAFGLLPLTVLLAIRVGELAGATVLGAYGVLTLVTTLAVMFIAFSAYRDRSEDAPEAFARSLAADAPSLPLVSCMVAVRNEEAVIARCVRSLAYSTYPRKELIVVDDGSTDATLEILLALRGELEHLRVIAISESVGKKRALTLAAAEARGDIFAFTDSDCVLEPDALERTVRALAADPDIGAVSGHARALNADQSLLTRIQDTWYDGQFGVWKAAESVFGAVTCVSGPLAVFRREAIYNYLPAWAQDTFLGREFRFATDRQLTGYVLAGPRVGNRLKRRHADSPFVRGADYPARRWRVEYVKSARVRTVVPGTLRRFLTQQVRWKKSFIRSLFFTGTFYWQRGGVPAFLYYSHVLFVLAMPYMAAVHLIVKPATGALLAAALYVAGAFFKGSIWALAYRVENPRCARWVYRPLMSVLTAVALSLLLPYSLLTLRRSTWVRG